jgi:NADH dehydrogenase
MVRRMRDWIVTGANGHVARGVLRRHGARTRALVRSARAARALADEGIASDVRVVDPRDEDALARAAEGCSAWLHLVGILKETRAASYRDAHERTAEIVARAAARAAVARLVSVSILGASPSVANACLASKGRADEILLAGRVPATIIRVPMVLGPGELAAFALRARASAPVTFLVRGGATLEQPLDARDLARGLEAALGERGDARGALDLAGPESLPQRALVERVAAALGRPAPHVVAVPRGVAAAAAALLERLPSPPLTRAMLGVLEHDDAIDPGPAVRRLGLTLTPLAQTLADTFGGSARLAA